ncbi:MAG: sulfite exporter TauE/SafE family protein [Candidatus Binatia bacterium]
MMDELTRFFLVFVVGSVGQLMDGTLGMGFGVFSASMLLTAGFAPVAVVATVNTAKILTGIFSGLAHWRAGNVRVGWLLPLIVPGIAGGVLGAHFLVSVPQDRFRFWMALVLVLMGLFILCRCLFPGLFVRGSSQGESKVRWIRSLSLVILGLAAGALNASSGAYGPFATSGLMLITRAKTSRAVGTVNFAEIFVAASVISTFLFKKGLHAPSWDLVLALVLGGALTAPLAAYACRKLPTKLLQLGVGLALISLNLRAVISQLG